jgi:hypothetical protein
VWLFAAQAVLLAVAAWRNLHQLNPDAVAYCRIAGYYVQGQWDLAVTGYWGPLLSWLMVPLLKLGVAPLVAARVVLAGSGTVFLCGAVAMFRAFRLPRMALLTGAWMAMGWSVFWSVRHITPDLLMAGLVGLAVSATVNTVLAPCRRFELAASSEQQTPNAATASHPHGSAPRHAIAAGVWWGLAYLTKAVALPLALLTTAGLAALALSGRGQLRREMARRLGLAWLCCALVAGLWMAALSLHYGKFTFSTTGPIAHALAGPGEASGYHPAMVTLHQPDAGRVTQWEEPSRMAYRHWSPMASGENLRHQFAVMGQNVATLTEWLWGVRWLSGADDSRGAARLLPGFDLLGLSLAGVVGGAVGVFALHRRRRRVRWSWAVVPVAALGGLYLPFFVMAEDSRYFHAALPFVWVLVIGAWGWVSRGDWEWAQRIRTTVFRVAAWAFLIPPVLWLGVALYGIPNHASQAAHALAVPLKSSGHAGPIAGSGLLPGGRAGLYTAFLLGERWLGDDPQAGPAEFAAAGARVVVLRRDARQAGAFASDSHWRAFEMAAPTPLLIFLRENP